MRISKRILIFISGLVAITVIFATSSIILADTIKNVQDYEISLEEFSKICNEGEAVSVISDDGLVEVMFPSQPTRESHEDRGYRDIYYLEQINPNYGWEYYSFSYVVSKDGDWTPESIRKYIEPTMRIVREESEVDTVYTKGREMIRYKGVHLRYGVSPDGVLMGRAFSIGNKLYVCETRFNKKNVFEQRFDIMKRWAFFNSLTVY